MCMEPSHRDLQKIISYFFCSRPSLTLKNLVFHHFSAILKIVRFVNGEGGYVMLHSNSRWKDNFIAQIMGYLRTRTLPYWPSYNNFSETYPIWAGRGPILKSVPNNILVI